MMDLNKLAAIIGAVVATAVWASFASARQVHDDRPRELAGVSHSESFKYEDGAELDIDASVITRMLYRLQKSSLATQDRFVTYTRDKDWSDVFQRTADHRFWMFEFAATLNSVQVENIEAPDTPDSIKRIYRCNCLATDADGDALSCVVLTRALPQQLLTKQALDEPIKFRGLLYCLAECDIIHNGESQSSAVFIADGVSWFPETTSVAGAEMVALASGGFDVGLLDAVRSRNGRSLGRRDRAAFYQLILASSKLSADQRSALDSVPLESVIARSGQHIGDRVETQAQCRQCTRVVVAEPEIQRRYGFDHYYQLTLFPKFDQPIVLTETRDGQIKKVTVDRYPVTVCCARLPDGLTLADMQKSFVAIDGTFFRIWKYQSQLDQRSNLSGTISPLIIADCPAVMQPAFWLNDIVSWLFLGGILVLLLISTYYRFFNQPHRRKTGSLIDQLPPTIDVESLSDV